MRQRPNRYAIRAGQNLPDKEFRYLRTVIVTAAVYWGFGSLLSQFPLTFQHRAGVSPYTSSFDLAQTCVFAKQLPGPILCGSFEHPLFRSYGVNLPSSLTTLLPLALGFSPHLPVSVCGTGTLAYIRAFLASAFSLSTPSGQDVSLSQEESPPELPFVAGRRTPSRARNWALV